MKLSTDRISALFSFLSRAIIESISSLKEKADIHILRDYSLEAVLFKTPFKSDSGRNSLLAKTLK